MPPSKWKFTVTPFTEEEERAIGAVDPKYEAGTYGRISPPGVALSANPERIDAMLSMDVYEDDLFVVTPPKCGTTWMQEVAWLVRNGVDLEGAKEPQVWDSTIPRNTLKRLTLSEQKFPP